MATYSSQGSVLKVTISAVATAIPNITSMSFPGPKREFEETTALDTSGNFKTYQATMNDTEEITVEGHWDPANAAHDYLMDQAMLATAVVDTFSMEGPTGAGTPTMAFTGYVAGFTADLSPNQSMKFTLTIRPTGAPTYTQ